MLNTNTVLQLCINPDSYQVGPQTIAATSEIDLKFSNQAPVVQTLDSVIHRIKMYPVDNAIGD